MSSVTLGTDWRINASLKPCPPFLVALTCLGEPFADTECGTGVTFVLEREISVSAPNEDSSSS